MSGSGFVSRPIALVGIAGSGKSTVAWRLAAELGGPWIGLDAGIARATGRSITELFAGGEAAFREREAAALARAVAEQPMVIDCGGGIVLDPRNRTLLKECCRTVWLEVAPDEAARRLGPQADTRPLLAGGSPQAVLERQLADRGPLYEDVASWRIGTDGRSVREIVSEIRRRLEEST